MDVIVQKTDQFNPLFNWKKMQFETDVERETSQYIYGNLNEMSDVSNFHQVLQSPDPDDGGMLLVWGCGEFGQHGHGHQSDISLSTGVCNPLVLGQDVVVMMVACGSSHTICITDDNHIYSWGNGNSGQLGIGQSKTVLQPHSLQLGMSLGNRVKGITCGTRHTFIWTDNGECYSFGNNFSAQLGYDFRKPDFKENQQSPVYLEALFNQKVVQVACGARHSLFLFSSGLVASVGANDRGQLGLDSKTESVCIQNIPDLQDISVIGCGNCHSLAADGNGNLYAWGYGKACGSKEDILAPKCIYQCTDGMVRSLEGGDSHSLALLDNGTIYSWGVNFEGQLGLGDQIKFQTSPAKIAHAALQGHAVSISVGENTSAATTEKGDLYMWGRNVSQVFRDDEGPRYCQFSPYRVSMGNWKAIKVSLGSWHVACIVASSIKQAIKEFPFESNIKNDLSEILYNNENESLSHENRKFEYENLDEINSKGAESISYENHEMFFQEKKDLHDKKLEVETSSREMHYEQNSVNGLSKMVQVKESEIEWKSIEPVVESNENQSNETNKATCEVSKSLGTSTLSVVESKPVENLKIKVNKLSISESNGMEINTTVQNSEIVKLSKSNEISKAQAIHDETLKDANHSNNLNSLEANRSKEDELEFKEVITTDTNEQFKNNEHCGESTVITHQNEGLHSDNSANIPNEKSNLNSKTIISSKVNKPSSAPCNVVTTKASNNSAKRLHLLRRTHSEDSSVCKTIFDLVPTKHGEAVRYSRTIYDSQLVMQDIKTSQDRHCCSSDTMLSSWSKRRHSLTDSTRTVTTQNTFNDPEGPTISKTDSTPVSVVKEKDFDSGNATPHLYGTRLKESDSGSLATTQLRLSGQGTGQLNREKKAPRHIRRVPSTPEYRLPNQPLHTADHTTRNGDTLQRTQSNPNINISGHKINVHHSSSVPGTPPSHTHMPHPPPSTSGLPPRYPGYRRPNSQKIVFSSGSSWRRRNDIT